MRQSGCRLLVECSVRKQHQLLPAGLGQPSNSQAQTVAKDSKFRRTSFSFFTAFLSCSDIACYIWFPIEFHPTPAVKYAISLNPDEWRRLNICIRLFSCSTRARHAEVTIRAHSRRALEGSMLVEAGKICYYNRLYCNSNLRDSYIAPSAYLKSWRTECQRRIMQSFR